MLKTSQSQKRHSRRNQFFLLQAFCEICLFVLMDYMRFCLLEEIQLIVSVISSLSVIYLVSL